MDKAKRKIVLVLHDIRSTHNVGSILRSAEGLGVDHVYLSGITPYPLSKKDGRLPHLAKKLDSQIAKTALGAEKLVAWSYEADIDKLLTGLRSDGYQLVALELTPDATNLSIFKPSKSVALILGNEVNGLDKRLLKKSDVRLKIPMSGQKESFNVSVAAAIAMYHIKYLT